MKSLVYLTVVLIAISLSGCHSYEEDQLLMDEISELQKAQIEKQTDAGDNNGSNPR